MLIGHIPKKKLFLAAGDVVLLSLAYFLSPIIRFGVLIFTPWDGTGEWLAVLVLYLFAFYIFDLYDTDPRLSKATVLARSISGVLAASGFYIIASFFVRDLATGRGLFGITAVSAAFFTCSWRIFVRRFLHYYYARGEKNLLIVGAGPAGVALYEALGDSPYKVVGFIDDDPQLLGLSHSPKVLGGSDALCDLVADRQADEIAVAVTHLESVEKSALLRGLVKCKMQGVKIHTMSALYEMVTGKIPVTHISDIWFVNTAMSGTRKGVYNPKLKRLLDIGFSLAGLLCGLPFLLPVCIAIKLDSKGPIFYRQKRTGADDTVFHLLKFRSMIADAEQNGAVWAQKQDPRATRVGRVMRKLRIDEVPQIYNVLKGDISFIGPRPERPEFVEMLEKTIPYYGLRHSVKPGITGWAQVNYPYGASEADALEKLKYDLYYIKNLSAFLDFHILLRTLRVVLFRKGAR